MHPISASAILIVVAGLSACVSPNSSSPDASGDPATTGESIDCSTAIPGESFRADMLCAHNAVREAPPAPQPAPEPPLPALIWNQDLADFARAHAESCTYEHSSDSARKEAFGQWVGENIAAGTVRAYSDRAAVNLWAAEAANYDYQVNTCAAGKVCGHYTQIVWRDTTQVGCAKVTCDTLANQEQLGSADLWVCDYLPGGNVSHEQPY